MEYITKRRKAADEAAETTSSARRTLLGSAAGTATGAPLRSVDPVFQIASCFTERFDALGKQNAAKMSEVTEKRTDDCEECRNITKQPGAEELRKQHDSPEYVHSASELRDGNFTDRFSEYAFRGGKLAASVMAGQGKQMFTVCLARALGKSMPLGERQKKILGDSRIEMPVPNMSSDVTFNRDVSSAVGIVTDTMRGSTRILDLFRSLVEDSGQHVSDPLELRRIGTLRQTLPFLDTESDRAMMAQYRNRIRELEGESSPDSAAIAKFLRSALAKQGAVLQRKIQQQREFLTVLNRISSNVAEAEKLFSSDGFAESAAEEVSVLSQDDPPEDGRGDSLAESIATAVADFFSGLRGEGDPGADALSSADGEAGTGAGEKTGGNPDGSGGS